MWSGLRTFMRTAWTDKSWEGGLHRLLCATMENLQIPFVKNSECSRANVTLCILEGATSYISNSNQMTQSHRLQNMACNYSILYIIISKNPCQYLHALKNVIYICCLSSHNHYKAFSVWSAMVFSLSRSWSECIFAQ